MYNFPGGLIDDNETVVVAATRELKEETGLCLMEVFDVLAPAYTAVGISNEAVTTVIGYASGEIRPSDNINEDITTKWYSKEEVKQLIESKSPMSLRTQSFLYMWTNN